MVRRMKYYESARIFFVVENDMRRLICRHLRRREAGMPGCKYQVSLQPGFCLFCQKSWNRLSGRRPVGGSAPRSPARYGIYNQSKTQPCATSGNTHKRAAASGAEETTKSVVSGARTRVPASPSPQHVNLAAECKNSHDAGLSPAVCN